MFCPGFGAPCGHLPNVSLDLHFCIIRITHPPFTSAQAISQTFRHMENLEAFIHLCAVMKYHVSLQIHENNLYVAFKVDPVEVRTKNRGLPWLLAFWWRRKGSYQHDHAHKLTPSHPQDLGLAAAAGGSKELFVAVFTVDGVVFLHKTGVSQRRLTVGTVELLLMPQLSHRHQKRPSDKEKTALRASSHPRGHTCVDLPFTHVPIIPPSLNTSSVTTSWCDACCFSVCGTLSLVWNQSWAQPLSLRPSINTDEPRVNADAPECRRAWSPSFLDCGPIYVCIYNCFNKSPTCATVTDFSLLSLL